MFRRALAVIAATAVALGGLTFGAAPASAAITGESINPVEWQPGATNLTTVKWTDSLTKTGLDLNKVVYVEVEWDWNATFTTGTTQSTVSGTTATCPGGITFSSPGFTFTGQPNCVFLNSGAGQQKYVVLQDLNGTNFFNYVGGQEITVTFPSGVIRASTVPKRYRWTVKSMVAINVSSNFAYLYPFVPAADGTVPAPPTIRLEINGNGGVCTPSFVEGEQGTWGTAPTADKCTNGSRRLAFFSTSPTAALGATNVAPGGPVYFLTANLLYAIWAADPPSPPTNVVATPGLNSVRVSWAPPASDGGAPILIYNVRYKATTDTNYRTFCNTNAATLQCTAAVPATNTQYTFIVSAANQVGRAEAAPSSPVSPYDFKDITASRDDVLFGLGGTKVDANGVAPGLAGRTLNVQFKVGSAAEWTTLTNAVKVNAKSNFSWSRKFPASANKRAVTVRFTYGTDAVSGTYVLPRGGRAGDLSAPRNIKANGELNKVTLTWDAPKFDGGAKIIGYTICAEYIGTLCRDVGPAGQGDFRNLLPGASYSFTVAARTAAKTGPKGKANKEVRFTEASVRITAREPGSVIILAEGRGFPDANTLRLEVAAVPSTNQPRDRWRWAEIRTLTGGSRFSKTVEAELGSSYDNQTIAVRLVTPLGSVYSKPSRPPR